MAGQENEKDGRREENEKKEQNRKKAILDDYQIFTGMPQQVLHDGDCMGAIHAARLTIHVIDVKNPPYFSDKLVED
ncbi:MAG: hypothetical protein HFH82_07160 [Lachnospiraceae bacterium]|nr:hypothetical protein [Lachnospiraceae bacterium]